MYVDNVSNRQYTQHVPDLDRIERSLLRGWRPAWNLVKGGHSDDLVANALGKALACALREHQGAPQLLRMADALRGYESGALSRGSLQRVASRFEAEMRHGRHAKVAARSLLACAGRFDAGRALGGAEDQALAEEFCWRLAEHSFFGRVRGELVARHFESAAEERDWEQRIRRQMGPHVEKLAKALARDPSGRGIRAPSRGRTIRRTTVELLDEPLL